MSSSPLSATQVPEPTSAVGVRDDVSWKQEKALRMGVLGFDMRFPDAIEVATSFSHDNFDANGWPEPAEDDSYLVQAAMDVHRSVCSLQHHQQLMRQNSAVVAAALRAVDQRLTALRRSGKGRAHKSLREKVVELSELKHPKPKPNYVTVWVNPRPTTGLNQMMEINIPLMASLHEVNEMLREVTPSELSYLKSTVRPNMPVEEEGGRWKNQLLSRDLTLVINKTSVLLENDNDYSYMINTVTTDAKAPLAVLTQEKITRPMTTSDSNGEINFEVGTSGGVGVGVKIIAESTNSKQGADAGPVWDDDEEMNEPLDMDGNAYFDPPSPDGKCVNWDRVSERMQNYDYGDWPTKIDEEEENLIERMVACDSGREYQG